MAIVQWVNLEKDSDYLDDPDISSLDRCGKLTIKTAFAKGNVDLSYKVKVKEVGSDNVTYSAAELGRNSNFKMTEGATDLGTEAEVTMEDTIQLRAAGGNKYKLEAKDANGKVVSSEEIEAKRKLYYQFMHMEDAKGEVKKYGLEQLEQHCLKNHVVLSKGGKDKKIPFRKNINTSMGQHQQFADDIKAQYDLKTSFKQVGCVTVLSNYLATHKDKIVKITHEIGDNINPLCTVSATLVDLWVLEKDFLWYGLEDGHDQDKGWFVKGRINYKPFVNTTNKVSYSVDFFKSDIEIGGSDINQYGGRNSIQIKISPSSNIDKIMKEKDGTLTFAIKFYIINGFSGGFSYPADGVAITTCCTKSWFRDESPNSSDVIWNHELGHRMGMVAHGNSTLTQGRKETDGSFQNRKINKNRLPDAPPNVYGEDRGVNDKGHAGPHCSSGSLTYNEEKDEWKGTPKCVLFGATGTSTAASPLDYCKECKDVVRKLDLSF
jgi:hypothetical protein